MKVTINILYIYRQKIIDNMNRRINMPYNKTLRRTGNGQARRANTNKRMICGGGTRGDLLCK